eukprot:366366-Chlamydomonas_euryale.AAC.9
MAGIITLLKPSTCAGIVCQCSEASGQLRQLRWAATWQRAPRCSCQLFQSPSTTHDQQAQLASLPTPLTPAHQAARLSQLCVGMRACLQAPTSHDTHPLRHTHERVPRTSSQPHFQAEAAPAGAGGPGSRRREPAGRRSGYAAWPAAFLTQHAAKPDRVTGSAARRPAGTRPAVHQPALAVEAPIVPQLERTGARRMS